MTLIVCAQNARWNKQTKKNTDLQQPPMSFRVRTCWLSSSAFTWSFSSVRVVCVCVCFCFRAAYFAKIFFRGDVCTVAAAAATKRCYSISSLVQEIAFCERKFASDFLIHLPIACSLWQLFSLLFFLFANALDWSHLSAFKQHLFAI